MNIEVFQDLICPWCRIGNQKLKEALDQWEGEAITIQYRTFLLNPGTPEGGITFNDYMKLKGAENVDYDDFVNPIIESGEEVGLNFKFDGLGTIANTIQGHRLLHLVPEENKSDTLDLLHTAYFEDGKNISDNEILLEVAKNQNLDVDALKAELEGDGGKEATIMDFYYAVQIGIKGVPLFIFDNKAVLNGVQEPSVILETMAEVSKMDRTVETIDQ